MFQTLLRRSGLAPHNSAVWLRDNVSCSSTLHKVISSPVNPRPRECSRSAARSVDVWFLPLSNRRNLPAALGVQSGAHSYRRAFVVLLHRAVRAVRSILNDDYLNHVTPASAFAPGGVKPRLIPGRLRLCLFFPCLHNNTTPSPARFQRPLVNILLTVMLVETCNPFALRVRVYRRLTICSQAARRHPDP
jgi:hypothetical protein